MNTSLQYQVLGFARVLASSASCQAKVKTAASQDGKTVKASDAMPRVEEAVARYRDVLTKTAAWREVVQPEILKMCGVDAAAA